VRVCALGARPPSIRIQIGLLRIFGYLNMKCFIESGGDGVVFFLLWWKMMSSRLTAVAPMSTIMIMVVAVWVRRGLFWLRRIHAS